MMHDEARSMVIDLMQQLVANGIAQWRRRDGALVLHLKTGESFLMGRHAIVRMDPAPRSSRAQPSARRRSDIPV